VHYPPRLGDNVVLADQYHVARHRNYSRAPPLLTSILSSTGSADSFDSRGGVALSSVVPTVPATATTSALPGSTRSSMEESVMTAMKGDEFIASLWNRLGEYKLSAQEPLHLDPTKDVASTRYAQQATTGGCGVWC
jgi:hypothetical protein